MDAFAEQILDRCARGAVRAAGWVEPNPMVGCAITAADGRVLGIGHHRRIGQAHAEIEALSVCRARGESAEGATAWVTLEPCGHHGRTPPCADALIEAGIARVVYARRDPKSGGAERLREAGVVVEEFRGSESARRLSDPFVMRVVEGRPWVTVKWAQTIDGKIAARGGDSKWISNARSRRFVHRVRGRVDVVLTGIGTVLADDPVLTARGVRVRRRARRVVIDPEIETPAESKLARSAGEGFVGLVVDPAALEGKGRERAARLHEMGVSIQPAPMGDGLIDLRAVLGALAGQLDATNVLVEAGAGLVGSLHDQGLIDELMVFTAPMLAGDASALGPVRGRELGAIAEAARMRLCSVNRIGEDVLTRYRREME